MGTTIASTHPPITKRNYSHQKMEAANNGKKSTAQLLADFQLTAAARMKPGTEALAPGGKKSTAQLLADFQLTAAARMKQGTDALASDGKKSTAQLLADFKLAAAAHMKQGTEAPTPNEKKSTAQLLADFKLAAAAHMKQGTEALAPNSGVKAAAPPNHLGVEECYQKNGGGSYGISESYAIGGALIVTAVLVVFLAFHSTHITESDGT
ncbi:hypothetical protein HOY82DRAFT_315432 [Tuber indicum]|nr:hypothetical protein HOY82DRAFT_315432 [Tuber indicum]